MENEIYGSRENRLKGTKHFERRQKKSLFFKIVIFLIVAFAFSLIYTQLLMAQSITRQQRINQYNRETQISNGIDQREWTIVYKNN